MLVESSIPRLDRLLDYRIPTILEEKVVVGGRVRVPLGKGAGRLVPGYVVSKTADSDYLAPLAEIDSALGSVPVLTPELWKLARTVADRAGGGASDVLRLAIPKRIIRAENGYEIVERPMSKPLPESRGVMQLDCGVAQIDGKPTRAGFMQIAERVKTETGGVIVVLPDWRDVALFSRALGSFPHQIFDSSLPNGERYHRYLSTLSGESRLVIGTRNAIYAPVRDLSLIVVVDESDPLLVEQAAPYVNARDVAIIRNGIEGGALIFASHTPSIVTSRFLELGFFEQLSKTPKRPSIVLANDASGEGFSARARIPSSAWRMVSEALKTGPVLVQVARPGFTPQVVCKACRTPHRCKSCKSILSGDRQRNPICNLCGLNAGPLICSSCGGRELSWSGTGSERTAEELGKAFPGVTVIVADAKNRQLEIPKKTCLVVATRGAEPITENGYRAVLILDGEKELQRASINTTENCLRWWGSAVALTAADGVAILAGVTGNFSTNFASRLWENITSLELQERKALGFPPATRAISITGEMKVINEILEISVVKAARIIGVSRLNKGNRLVLLSDYQNGNKLITTLRQHQVAAKNGPFRIKADDYTVFDDPDQAETITT